MLITEQDLCPFPLSAFNDRQLYLLSHALTLLDNAYLDGDVKELYDELKAERERRVGLPK